MCTWIDGVMGTAAARAKDAPTPTGDARPDAVAATDPERGERPSGPGGRRVPRMVMIGTSVSSPLVSRSVRYGHRVDFDGEAVGATSSSTRRCQVPCLPLTG
ncbi:hypothetical protein AB0A74_16365 [Saccharothrix sp. NPDC042600]|uniref:hypothetical protein n=1 Tax=Saccharothrix TaxID=2071 RepID=UPI0033C98118|nr:hypothetical protein GCM10017745_45990 [Saccharothrix mutabilis subsp. capreolus]